MAVNDVNNHCLYGSSCFCLSRSLSSNSKVLTHGSKFCSGSTLGCHHHLLIFSAFFSIADLTACDLHFSFNHYFLVPWYSKCVVWIIRTIWNPTRNVEFAVILKNRNVHFHRTPGCHAFEVWEALFLCTKSPSFYTSISLFLSGKNRNEIGSANCRR